MLFNLHLTHWSLLFITLISSCFLFYVVACENAKYVTTKQTSDTAMASVVTSPPPPRTTIKQSINDDETVITPHNDAATIDHNTDYHQHAENVNAFKEYRNDRTENILPNYKKLKKLITTQEPASDYYSEKIQNRDNLEGTEQHTTPILSNTIAADSADGAVNGDSGEITFDNSKIVNNNENIVVAAGESEHSTNGIENEENNNIHSSAEEHKNNVHLNDIAEGKENDGGFLFNQQVPDVVVDLQSQYENTGDGNVNPNANDEGSTGSLPDITDIPTVTITELPLEILQPSQNSLDSVIISSDIGGDRTSPDDKVNRTVDIIVNTDGQIPKDGQIVKINDSSGYEDTGGGTTTPTTSHVEHPETLTSTSSPSATNIPNIANTNDTRPPLQSSTTINESLGQEGAATSASSSSPSPSTSPSISTSPSTSPTSAAASAPQDAANQVNLTAEEVPMPVFSEWAQKQMEAAEKQEQKQQEQTFNNSAQRKNNTNGHGKPPALKVRAKNYASPDCGAKIIASSAYTSNAGAVLSSSKDEYMLSLCGNRIWFVVELCEAIQAQKIDFANFELYSSSPQNFTVAVSKRFPTREWSNVGRFAAEDKRAVQGFDLHPHLFGKFVRVDINSHYSKEHYCTLSLFRVFGTSEFEAFETENHPNEDLYDFEDEDLQEQNIMKIPEQNLFKSASDAVLSIVKKATELVGKPLNNQNHTFKTAQHSNMVCRTPVDGSFSCAECSASLVERVNSALSCEFSQLNSLLQIADIRSDLLSTRVCTKRYGIETLSNMAPHHKDIRRSFYVNILPNAYVGALCQLLATPNVQHSTTDLNDSEKNTSETSSNQTVDKRFGKEDMELVDEPEKKLLKKDIQIENDKSTESPAPEAHSPLPSTESPQDDTLQQLPRPLNQEDASEATTVPPKNTELPSIPNKNIYNVPAGELNMPLPEESATSEQQQSTEALHSTTSDESVEQVPTSVYPTKVESQPVTTTTAQPPTQPKSEEDSNSWDNIESLLTSTPSTTITTTGVPQNHAGGGFPNQKISNGGPQTESVFIRLSNRIKALERNMSLSGQYLEELSRRYKKQVEELQQTLTQQSQTVRTLEEQNRRHHELEELYAQRNAQLKHELDDLTLQVHACIVVIIFVGAFVFMVLMVGILFYRSMRRDTKEVLSLYGKGAKKKTEPSNTGPVQKKMNRRKSFEDYSNHQHRRGENDIENIGGTEKTRRPSEEAMLILKDCKDDAQIVVGHMKVGTQNDENASGPGAGRQRKLSICYGSNSNLNGNTSGDVASIQTQKSSGGGGKSRRGDKHSWPNSAQTQLLARQHLEQLNSEELKDTSALLSNKAKFQLVGKSKKKRDFLRRQESSPADITRSLNNTLDADNLSESADFDQKLILDEDDLDNFIPNADLVYNEFMPEGPRGYQCSGSPQTPNANSSSPNSKKIQSTKSETNNSKKARRLSSPVFFKSPFPKSLKGKITSSKSNPAHESTSWEWYRLKKSSSANGPKALANSSSATTNAFLSVSPNASLDSSSLSEINFPTNSSENSFRILEEAILSSGESAITTTTSGSSKANGVGNSRSVHRSTIGMGGDNMIMTSGISSSSNSNRSSSSTSSSTESKKKNRTFNKIFRKVF